MSREKEINKYILPERLINALDYIYNSDRDEKAKVTEYLLQNPLHCQALEGIIDLCIDQKFTRKQAERYFESIGISIPTIFFEKDLIESTKSNAGGKKDLLGFWGKFLDKIREDPYYLEQKNKDKS